MMTARRGTFDEWWALAGAWVRRDAEADDPETKAEAQATLADLDEIRGEDRWRRTGESIRDWLDRTIDPHDDEEAPGEVAEAMS